MSIRLSPAVEHGVDSLFYCWARVRGASRGVEEEFIRCRASEFWGFSYRERRYTEFIGSGYAKPSGYVTVSLRSRDLFRYGVFELRARLVRAEGGPLLWFGFELEDLFAGGAIHYRFDTSKGSLSAHVGSSGALLTMDLTGFLPGDYDRVKHWYRIQVTRKCALWYIDDRLRALSVIAPGPRERALVVHSSPPYAVGLFSGPISSRLAVLMDIDGAPDTEYVWPDLNPWDLRVSEGFEDPPLAFELYPSGSDEPLAGSETSHRITTAPVPGVGRATIVVHAEGSGSISIEASINGREWHVVDEVMLNGRASLRKTLDREAAFYRISVEPRGMIKFREASALII